MKLARGTGYGYERYVNWYGRREHRDSRGGKDESTSWAWNENRSII